MILIHGCSNTAGSELNKGECWSDLIGTVTTSPIKNLAYPGNNNHLILRIISRTRTVSNKQKGEYPTNKKGF